jgi:hypothetical protein
VVPHVTLRSAAAAGFPGRPQHYWNSGFLRNLSDAAIEPWSGPRPRGARWPNGADSARTAGITIEPLVLFLFDRLVRKDSS